MKNEIEVEKKQTMAKIGTQRITPCLWFDDQAEEAANFYTSVFKNSKIGSISRYGKEGAKVSGQPEGSVMTVKFWIEGQEFVALNGGPQFKFSEAISFIINCETQKEIDYFWQKLTADGGEESVCGWLKDKYGVSWQVVPVGMDELSGSENAEKMNRVMKALVKMKKIDMRVLKEAAQEQEVLV